MKERVTPFLDNHAGLLLSLPALTFLLLFIVWPFVLACYGSLTNMSFQTLMHPGTTRFNGLNHYRDLLGDPAFRNALKNSFHFTLLTVPLQTALALCFAVIVNGSLLWQRILRTCFFMPVITSMAVLSVIWSLLYNPQFGAFNGFLGLLGLPPQPFLDSPFQALYCIVVMSVWQGVGFQMMIFLAGLQAIPGELYEIARLDGAGPIQRFKYITLPLLKNTTVLVIFITTVFAFKLFVQPHLITHGGPEGTTTTLILLLYDEAFTHGRYGRASAVAVTFFVVVLAVALLQRKLLPKEDKA